MSSLSKLLNYTCYEAAHTWNPSCSRASLEVLITGFIKGFRMYAVVYLLSALMTKKKFSKESLIRIFTDNVRSACFLSVNAGGFVAAHCAVRAIFQHINFISAAFIPGFLASFLAVLVERKSRRSLLAIYVTNVASECAWNILVRRGYITPIPYGNVMLFSLTMTLFGYHFKKTGKFSTFIESAMQLVLGKNESAKSNQVAPSDNSCRDKPSNDEVKDHRSSFCVHKNNCWRNIVEVLVQSFCKGYVLQAGINILTSIPKIFRNSSVALVKMMDPSCMKMALFFMWFSTSYQGICCLLRRVTGKDRAYNGAIAGAVAGLGMAFNPSTSVALYALWKAIEALYEREQKAGHMPSIPAGIEILYSLSTAFLFHLAIMENFNLKSSYWRFLLQLAPRIGECNRILLKPYDLDSGRNQIWPNYDVNHLTDSFKRKYADRLHLP